MTAQTPAPKASGVCAPLASFSPAPPSAQPSVKEDFLALILQALTAPSGGADHPSSAQTAKEKPSSTETAAAPDPTAASLLLALLAPPLPALAKSLARKISAPSVSGVSSAPPAPPATVQTAADPKQAKTARAYKAPHLPGQPPPLLPGQAPAPKAPQAKLAPASGTSAANTSERMNYSSERNEIAGRTEQKLPLTAVSAVSGADTGSLLPDSGGKSSLPFSWQDAPAEALTIIDLSAKAAGPSATVAEAATEAPTRAAGAAPLERLEQMIAREVGVVRQTGAQTLGVSLKLDTNTQLYLQLTTTNGLTQASVRCERGQFAPEETQWAQLQQSLARQNVELLPMTGGSNLNFQQPSEERPRHLPAREDWAAPAAAVPPAPPRKQKEQNRPRKNWESWA